jgi:MFS family permease
MGLAPDGDFSTAPPSALQHASVGSRPLRNPCRDRRFITLAASATLGLFAQIGLIDHLFSLLAPRLGDGGAGAIMAMATACAILGRILLAHLLPANTNRRMAAAANVAMQALGSVALLCAGPSLPLILLGCALFGLGLGNVTSLPPLIAQAEFTPADLARVVALVTAISQAGYAFAPAAFGLLRGPAAAPSAVPLFAAAALIQLAAAAAILLGRQRAPGARPALAGLAD